MKAYEAMFIFPDTLKDDGVQAATDRAKAEIEKVGGAVREVVPMGKRGFARPLKKRDAGYYVRICFDAEPDKIALLTARYKLIDSVFRVQIVSAPRKAAPVGAAVSAPKADPVPLASPAGTPSVEEGTPHGKP